MDSTNNTPLLPPVLISCHTTLKANPHSFIALHSHPPPTNH
jgi:hypothetical protein